MLWFKKIRKKLMKKTKKKFINKFIVSRFFKNKINLLLINVISFVIRLHINSVLCYILCPDINIKDFCLQVLVSILTTLSGDIVLYFLNKCDEDFYRVTRYFLNNFSEDNLEKWKKIFVVGINIYFICILLFVSITSYLLIYYSIQYLVCFFIIDYFKKEKWKYFKDVYRDYIEKPVIIQKFETLQLIDNHFDQELKKKGIKQLKIETVNRDYFNITTDESEEKRIQEEKNKVEEEKRIQEEENDVHENKVEEEENDVHENKVEEEENDVHENKVEEEENDVIENKVEEEENDVIENKVRKNSFDDSEFIIVN